MNIGNRINFTPYYHELTSQWKTPYGIIFLYTFIDLSGNIFIWKTSKRLPDSISTISGTIKDILIYNTKQEFELTYCKINSV